MHKAIFLDRDGTINEDVGDLYSSERLIFIPGAMEALKLLQQEYHLFIVTNQSGIGANAFTEKEFLQFNEYFIQLLDSHGVAIRHVFYCPHRKDENCGCRKPNPYFVKKAEKEYCLDIRNSYVIGDHPHDAEMAIEVGAGAVYLLTGHGKKHLPELSITPDYIADNIFQAALWIMGKNHRGPIQFSIDGSRS